MLLRFLGYHADKCDLADRYLPRSEVWRGADPDREYMGDPHRDDETPQCGYYCFAGPIIAAAKAYLSDHGAGEKFHPADLTGAEEEELIAQLKAGRPFLFWASLHFDDILFQPEKDYVLPNGQVHHVFHHPHCMVCCGMEEDCFLIADPLGYNSRVPRAQFMKIYRQLGSRAVVLVPA